MPNPPVTAVLPLPQASHAKPTRGCGRNLARLLVSAEPPMIGCVCKHTIHESVIRCAPLSFVPAVGGFGAEAGAQLQPRRHFDGVFNVGRAFKRTPAEFRGRWNHGERLHGALQKRLQRAERSLPILILRQQIVGLDALEPHACFHLIAPARPVDMIVQREQIARSPYCCCPRWCRPA